MCKRNSYFDNVIKAFLENWSSIFIILRFVPFFFLPQFWTGDSRIEWWDKWWLKNSTLLPNTWFLNKINVGYHCPESWFQGMECISSKFSVLNGKYFKKKPKKIGPRVQYNSARRQPWTRTEPEVSPVHRHMGHRARRVSSLFFSLSLSWTYLCGLKRILPQNFCHDSSRKSNRFSSKEQHFGGFPLIYMMPLKYTWRKSNGVPV